MAVTTARRAGLGGDRPANVNRWTAYRAAVLADSPIAYWPMDDLTASSTMVDVSGNARNGTYTNSPTKETAALAGTGTSVTFVRASSHYASVAHNAALNGSGAFTIEMWVKVTDVDAAVLQILIDKSSASSSGGQWSVWWDNQSGVQQLGAMAGSVGASNLAEWKGSGARTALAAGGHLVVTVSGSGSGQTVDMWWNGFRVANATSRTVTWTSGNTTAVNLARISAGYHLSAIVDEVALYGSALSEARILAHYNDRER